MKTFFQAKGFRILLAVVVIMLGLLLYTQSVGNSLTANLLNFLSSPMQAIGTSMKRSASETVENLTQSPDDLRAQIEELEKEIAGYKEQLVEFYDYKRKVVQYESILGIHQENPDFQMLAASVIGRDPNDVFYSFSIDQGSLNGVSVNDPVITSKGLVGWVSQVYATSSKVTTIFSEDTQFGATSKERRESGVITCDIKLCDQGLIKMGLLDTDTAITTGDIITTAGLGGLFPKDLLIGTVVSVEKEEFDVSRYVTIQPYENIKTVEDVFVITDFFGKGEITADASASESLADSENTSSEVNASSELSGGE